MTASTPGAAPRGRRSRATLAAFAFGLPAAAVALAAVRFTALRATVAYRYFEHPVEWVEVALFCCAVAALAAKLWRSAAEYRACRADALPPWDGRPVPVDEAPRLLARLLRLPRRLQNTYLAQRVAAVLDFLSQRRSAADLDDQLRALADADVGNLEGSYALTRFITWAIPILGFLGTVLGITGAIAGVKSDNLELSQVTGGLANAFDATALALGLTMIVMFWSFLVERAEQEVLDAVDRFVERDLAHRFQRPAAAGWPASPAEVPMEALGRLVQMQTDLWTKAMAEADKRSAEAAAGPREQFTEAVEAALEKTLQAHARRLAALEQQALEQGARLLEQMAGLAAAVRDTGREQQAALGRVAEGVSAQATALARIQDGEKDLIHLQAVLHQNLAALASASNFDQAVHSLTAAVHLLTARTAAPAGAAAARPGKAA
jgi:biopolymer transport protein ExbB/TolQ